MTKEKAITEGLLDGKELERIAMECGVTKQYVWNVKRKLEKRGVELPYKCSKSNKEKRHDCIVAMAKAIPFEVNCYHADCTNCKIMQEAKDDVACPKFRIAKALYDAGYRKGTHAKQSLAHECDIYNNSSRLRRLGEDEFADFFIFYDEHDKKYYSSFFVDGYNDYRSCLKATMGYLGSHNGLGMLPEGEKDEKSSG